MLKPFIVEFLVWSFKLGYIAGPILLVVFRLSADRARRSRMVSVITGLWVVWAAIGYVLGLTAVVLFYTVLCATFYGCSTLVARYAPATLLLIVPVAGVLAVLVSIYRVALDDSTNPLLPLYEKKLNAQTVCRGYPMWHDSIPATRLLLLRQTNSLKDEVLATVEGRSRAESMSCTILPDGRVHMELRARDGTWHLHKQVKLSGNTAVVPGNRHERHSIAAKRRCPGPMRTRSVSEGRIAPTIAPGATNRPRASTRL